VPNLAWGNWVKDPLVLKPGCTLKGTPREPDVVQASVCRREVQFPLERRLALSSNSASAS